MNKWILLGAALLVAGCREEAVKVQETVRGLKTYEVSETEMFSLRKFPAVLEASEITTLSFEVSGKLQNMTLDVGQRVAQGEVLARLDPESLELGVVNARSEVAEAQATALNALENAERQAALLASGSVTKVVADDARTQAQIAEASLDQAENALETALDNLGKTTLTAPFDGIVNSVEVESFSTINAATPIAQIYPSNSFEVSFSVNFDTVSRLVVGKPASVRLADRPDIVLDAVVSEIGSRADAVSSFPIVLSLRDTHPLLKAGMAVEAAIEFELPAATGFTIPLTAIINDGKTEKLAGTAASSQAGVYVFDPQTSTVQRRDILVAGIRGNSLIVIDGLEVGDRIASAGVSFLREGQEVQPLDAGE